MIWDSMGFRGTHSWRVIGRWTRHAAGEDADKVNGGFASASVASYLAAISRGAPTPDRFFASAKISAFLQPPAQLGLD